MKIALAIFAKTAELSPVKTRLAADIGEVNAKAFYGLSVSAIEAVVQSAMDQNPNLNPHWCVGEESGVTFPQWQSFPAIWTGDGGLGKRLATISETLFETHDAVIFIGTDSPQISPEIILKACAHLDKPQSHHIAGPALDGGFYLFGSNEPVPREIWENVKYSADTTLRDLETRLKDRGIQAHHVKSEQDVDTIVDLQSLKITLEANEQSLLEAQKSLLAWLQVNMG